LTHVFIEYPSYRNNYKNFASQFSSLQADNARLQEDAQSKSSQLDQAVKKISTARQEADS
jgi:hypothetical protein